MDSEKTNDLSFVESTLNGYVKSDAKFGGWGKDDETFKVFAPGGDPEQAAEISEEMKESIKQSQKEPTSVKIYNARELQAKYDSPSEFFQKYGFCLMHSPTKVKTWNENYLDPFTDIAKFYHKETQENLDKIYDIENQKEFEFFEVPQQYAVMRRGPGSKNNFYAQGIHQDYAMNAEHYHQATLAYSNKTYADNWLKKFNKDVVTGMRAVVLWRPILMEKPLTHMPLCVLDPNTVSVSDCLNTQFYGFAPNGPQTQMQLKYNENHRWYYYPNMTKDEVLVFTQFDQMKGVDNTLPDARVIGNFHTAFKDPSAPEQQEERKSCEHRVQIYFKKKGAVDYQEESGCCSIF